MIGWSCFIAGSCSLADLEVLLEPSGWMIWSGFRTLVAWMGLYWALTFRLLSNQALFLIWLNGWYCFLLPTLVRSFPSSNRDHSWIDWRIWSCSVPEVDTSLHWRLNIMAWSIMEQEDDHMYGFWTLGSLMRSMIKRVSSFELMIPLSCALFLCILAEMKSLHERCPSHW